ncbi:putative cell surface protein Mas1 [Lineolata rhizophorae]|uniref:Putative cell surface protein Mas1 n=1 Tax=Lineolata rhizophorae TaxID=578093 RepID=A0A6A6NMA9_9PEZI|nr:putative cell surface protein Mas1 [Lineolata rhizophorae]
MRYSTAVITAYAALVSGHGLITEIQGANNVTMPGLSVIDGTPRDCASPLCGSEDDTSIIRDRELDGNRASALGRTNGGGPVDADAAISTFMGGDAAKRAKARRQTDSEGTKTTDGTVEDGVARAAGNGATAGMPTCNDDGTITMTFHQVNQDGAGPLNAAIDPTSGGTDPDAFESAEMVVDVPGSGFLGLSRTTTTDFPITVQMPTDMTCEGSAGGVDNVCIVRVRNDAVAGPFGGSAAFTQSPAARKRAVDYRMRKRHITRGTMGKAEAN